MSVRTQVAARLGSYPRRRQARHDARRRTRPSSWTAHRPNSLRGQRKAWAALRSNPSKRWPFQTHAFLLNLLHLRLTDAEFAGHLAPRIRYLGTTVLGFDEG